MTDPFPKRRGSKRGNRSPRGVWIPLGLAIQLVRLHSIREISVLLVFPEHAAKVPGAAAQDDDDAAAADTRPRGKAQKPERRETPNAQAAAAVPAQVTPPQDPGARMADLRTRLGKMHVPAANHFERIAEWAGHIVDSKTELSADDWSRADAGIEEAQRAAETIGRAQDNASRAEH